jgi:2-keto-4-pentenoate hydratase
VADFDAAPAAHLLATAWRDDTQIVELPATVRPRNLREGYDIQDFVAARLGDATVGWKIGVGSPNALGKAGLDRPVVGRVTASRRFDAGATVELRSLAPVTIEFEIALVLACDIPPGDAPATPITAVESIHITCEVVRARYVDRRAVGWPSFVADNSGFRALVVGSSISAASAQRMADTVIVHVDGREAARGVQGDERTDPLASLSALLAHAAERGITLRRGDIVSTGTVSVPFDLARASADLAASSAGAELGFRLVMAP